MSTSAERVITKCGGGDLTKGLSLVALWTGVDRSRAYRWTRPKAKGGTGGVIPAQHQQTILDTAQRFGIALAPSDFFAVADDGVAAPRVAGAAS
jgi:hypothetical protein